MIPSGLIAFPITPMDADGRVDEAALRRLLGRLVAAGVEAVCVLGSTGSYPYLSRAERRRAVEIAADALSGRAALMAGVGALRTDWAIQHARDASSAGASLGLLAPMAYTPLTEREVFAHFEAVAGAGLPLCIYDNPAATHFPIPDHLVEALAALPGVVALKAPAAAAAEAPARLADLRARTPAGFSVGFSTDWNVTEVLIAGADAWYSVIAGLFPAPALAIARAAAAGDAFEARRLDDALAPLWALFQTHGSLRVIYAAADALGLCHHAPPRPLLPLERGARDEVLGVLRGLERVLED